MSNAFAKPTRPHGAFCRIENATKDIGRTFPQHQEMKKPYNYDASNSVHRLRSDKLPRDDTNFGTAVIHGHAKLTDLISSSPMSCIHGGYLVSGRFRELLEPFNLAPHGFYRVPAIHRKKQVDDYWWLHILPPENWLDLIEFPRSRFFRYEDDEPIEIASGEEFRNLEAQELRLYAKSYCLKADFLENIDMFWMPPIEQVADLYVSQRLRDAMEASQLTGIRYGTAKRLKDPEAVMPEPIKIADRPSEKTSSAKKTKASTTRKKSPPKSVDSDRPKTSSVAKTMLDLVSDIENQTLVRSPNVRLTGLNAFPLPKNHANQANFQRLDTFLQDLPQDFSLRVEEFYKSVSSESKESLVDLIRAVVPMLMASDLASERASEEKTEDDFWIVNYHLEPRVLRGLLSQLMRKKLPFTDDDLLAFLVWLDSYDWMGADNGPVAAVLKSIENRFGHDLPSQYRYRLQSILDSFKEPDAKDRKLMAKIEEMILNSHE